jgi:hypothetical protein
MTRSSGIVHPEFLLAELDRTLGKLIMSLGTQGEAL